MNVIAWRAWWWDGTAYSSEDHRWEGLPEDGWEAFVLYFDKLTSGGVPYRRIMMGSDYYFRADTEIGPIYGESHDPPEEIERRFPGASIKRGKWTSEAVMDRIREEANAAQKPPSRCRDCS